MEGDNSYNVVFQNISDNSSNGVVTWNSFDDEESFNRWYTDAVKKLYIVVDRGVTIEHAVELCSSPRATLAVTTSLLKNLDEAIEKLSMLA